MNRRANAARERADFFFLVYYHQGPGRSVHRLHTDLRNMGVRISMATLKRYSTRFQWQNRIATLDATARQQHAQQSVEDVLAMHERHTQLARALQGAGGSALQRLLANDTRLAGLRPSDIVRLIDLGFRAERNAVGASSDRREIAIEIWNEVLTSVVPIFEEINQAPDSAVRTERFAMRIDGLVDVRLAKIDEMGD